ncbi:MAG: polymerase sigma factor RpoH-related protein [Alphaproteobacteria bacterium]|nr:polymerase sigma factor RpoH-related protein [Alphaproteobacteria bacterium]
MAHIDDPLTQRADLTYIKGAMSEKLLERTHEQDLAKRWRYEKDEKALHLLIKAYTRLVVAMAHKFKHYGLPIGDLMQEGNIGLLEAANRFEPERDIRFSTYASWWIRSMMQDYVLRNWSIVRTGTTAAQKSLFFNFRRLRAKIEGEDGVILNDEARHKIAKELDVKYSDVVDMEQRMNGGDHSLNGSVGEEGDTEFQDLLPDERPDPEQVVIFMKDKATRNKWLATALGTLNDREQHIIKMRALSNDVVTLEALGKELGVSKERVRQLEARAMEKLKTSLIEQVGEPENLFI